MLKLFNSRTRVTQITRLATHYAKIPERGFCFVDDIVEDVRTVFEKKDDTTIFIPS